MEAVTGLMKAHIAWFVGWAQDPQAVLRAWHLDFIRPDCWTRWWLGHFECEDPPLPNVSPAPVVFVMGLEVCMLILVYSLLHYKVFMRRFPRYREYYLRDEA